MSQPKVEVIVVRDPDGGIGTYVYIDGHPASITEEYTIDAGSGWQWDEWREHRDRCLAAASPACRAELLDTFTDPPGGNYVEDRDDVDWLDGVPD